MKAPMTVLLSLTVACLMIVGIYCITTASDPTSFRVVQETRMPSLIAGLFSFSLGAGLVVFGVVMSRKP